MMPGDVLVIASMGALILASLSVVALTLFVTRND
jgi:hypothetical protein